MSETLPSGLDARRMEEEQMTQTTTYTFTRDLFEEARAHIAHEINERGEEAFNLALSEYGYAKVEEARDIELLRRKYAFEREGRIRALERLCLDLYKSIKYHNDVHDRLRLDDRMQALGLLEWGKQ